MKYVIRLFIFALIITFICDAQAESKDRCSRKKIRAIQTVIYHYLDTHTAVSSHDVKLSDIRCVSTYSSANVIPLKPVADAAIVYLHKIHDHWEVMSLGTSFDKEFLSTIPKRLRVPAE